MRKANGEREFYSRMLAGDGVEMFIDKSGNPTIDYPHVHVVHHGSGLVEVTASRDRNNHVWRKELRNPSGNEVNSAVYDARARL